MQIAACYIRVSTDDQTEFSPDAQLHAIREYAKKNDLIIPEEYIFKDEGISGRTAKKRPGFQNMIATAKIKPKQFETILVHRFDRFARNREDSIIYKSLLRRDCGIKVISITEPLEDDKMSVLMEAMLEAIAEYYSLNLSDEVSKGMKEKARRGGVLNKAPFGYKNNNPDTPPSVIEQEAEIVRFMFEKIYTKEMTPFTLARYLNEAGMLTRKGKTWGTFTLKYVLSNPFYTGKLIWNKYEKRLGKYRKKEDWIYSDAEHEAIISQDVFDKVQAILNENKHRRERPAQEHCHWLSGLIKCSNCGGSLSVSGFKKYPYFQCHNYNKGKCNVSHYSPVQTMENIIIKSLKDFMELEHPIINLSYKKRVSDSSKLDTTKMLNLKLKKAHEKLERVKTAFTNGIDTLEEYKENKAKILSEIDTVNKEIEEASTKKNSENKIKEIQDGLKEIIKMLESDEYTISEKNNLLKNIVSHITFDKRTKKIEVFYFY